MFRIFVRRKSKLNGKNSLKVSENLGGIGVTVANVFVLRCAATLLSRVRAPTPAALADGGRESLRSP
ncbi:transcription factor iiib 90 kda subunit [Plakobranchus ocellatus]|uniref:Transcription factor iiib 90 kDa subunit n=1 Tax=Plakobranchus ocellatus TaxID=259542 RepID=A0AAV4DKM6_9GAST|nr:transcription factor iiib 90 kda subunit [Plakobranchus ocellatus]